jgi:lysozyme
MLKADLERDEGRRATLYSDSLGVQTFGVGHNAYKPLSNRAIDLIFEDDTLDSIQDLDANVAWWRGMTEPRQRALCNMCFQLGWPRLRGFVKMLAALKDGDYEEAAHEAGSSQWATQTPNRAKRIIQMIKEG